MSPLPYYPSFRSVSLSLIFCLLLAGTKLYAQNADPNTEHLTEDYLFLQALGAQTDIGSYALNPVTLRSLTLEQRTPSSSSLAIQMADELRNLYAPILASAKTSELRWFERYDGRMHALYSCDSTMHFMADLGAMLRVGSVQIADSSHSFAMGNLNARAMGSIGDHLSYHLYLSNGILFHGDASYVKLTDPVLSRTLKFTDLEQKFFDRYVGYVQYESEHLRIRFGRENFSWGYSPIDNIVHSRYAPLCDGLLLDVPFKGVRFSSVHLSLDGVDTSGKAVNSKFLASHRLQIEAASWLSVGINDMVVYSGRGLDFAYLNPLAFYVSTGLSSKNKSEMDNSLLGFDMALRPMNNTLFYAAILLDDFSFNSLSDTSSGGNNNKAIWQVGASHYMPGLWSSPLISAEYVRSSAFVYSHREMNNSWTQLGAPLGYNMQPNSERVAMQLKFWLSARSSLQIDADYTRWGENLLDSLGNIRTAAYVPFGGDTLLMPVGNVGGDMNRGDGDFLPGNLAVGNTFLRGNLSITRRLQVQLSTEVMRNVFIDARALYQNRSGGNTPGKEVWAWLELRVGY